MGSRESCTCGYCRDGCTRKPGWFLPGEAEKAAGFMGMTLPDFFRAYLAVDWWVDDPDIFVLSPSIRAIASSSAVASSSYVGFLISSLLSRDHRQRRR